MPLYVVHVMSGGAVDEVARALRGGQRVVAEAVASGFAADERMVWDPDFRARGPARRARAHGGGGRAATRCRARAHAGAHRICCEADAPQKCRFVMANRSRTCSFAGKRAR